MSTSIKCATKSIFTQTLIEQKRLVNKGFVFNLTCALSSFKPDGEGDGHLWVI